MAAIKERNCHIVKVYATFFKCFSVANKRILENVYRRSVHGAIMSDKEQVAETDVAF